MARGLDYVRSITFAESLEHSYRLRTACLASPVGRLREAIGPGIEKRVWKLNFRDVGANICSGTIARSDSYSEAAREQRKKRIGFT